MSTQGNNHAKNYITAFREEHFTEARMSAFKELIEDKEEAKIHKKLKLQYAEDLYNEAQKVLKDLENEELPEQERLSLERKLVHLLAAIEDTESVEEKNM